MFRDIGKPAKDLFEEDYIFGQKIKFKSKNLSDFTLTGEAEFSPHKIPMALLSANRKGKVFSFDKLRIKSDGRLLAEVSLKTSSISKFTMSVEDGRQEPGKPLQSFGKFGVEVNMPNLNADADIDVVNGPLLHGSLLYKYGKYQIGGESLVNTHVEDKDQSPEITDLNVGMSYTGLDWRVIVRTTNILENVRLNYLHNISPNLLLATQVDYHLKSNSQRIAFGTKYILEENKSEIKTKFDSNAVLAGSFKHRLSDFVQLIVSGEVNVHDWSPSSHRFGLGLTFE